MFERYKEIVDDALDACVGSFGPQSRLRDAIEYALKNDGKRFRPAIVYVVANAIGNNADVTEPALAVEFFHTASLIADDLPCMDDDDKRRNLPALHIAFDEATALLATYALIAAGYERLRHHPNPEVVVLALENAAYNTGIFGATGGQYHDLFPPKLSKTAVLDVIDKKTGTLFEISFVFGWLYGGGEVDRLPEVKEVALQFGRAFQISDDFLDMGDGALNYPSVVGIEEASRDLREALERVKGGLKKLRLDRPELLKMVGLIEKRSAQTPAFSGAF